MLLYSWLLVMARIKKKYPGKSWTGIGLLMFFILQDQKGLETTGKDGVNFFPRSSFCPNSWEIIPSFLLPRAVRKLQGEQKHRK